MVLKRLKVFLPFYELIGIVRNKPISVPAYYFNEL